MSDQRFPRRQVERSFRKFNDTVEDLQMALHNTWGDTFDRLLTHCESDPVMQIVTGPLKGNKQIDAKAWLDESIKTDYGTVGSGRYTLPYDDDERTALLYQLLLLMNKGESNFSSFCSSMFGGQTFQDMTDSFTQELVIKFTREVSYRLDEILEDTGDSSEISSEAMIVFHHYDNSTTIHGDVQGSNVATGSGSVSNSTASYSNESEVIDAIEGMREAVHETCGGNGSLDVFESLLKAAKDNNADTIEVSARALCNRSPRIRERLTDIATGIATSLAGSALFKGLAFLLV